ncbi:MAG: HD-GYP domain-containing protein, partial [Thermovirga sp.]|nr:HD-GYP domain-containing protein [Thermovirga sp.]
MIILPLATMITGLLLSKAELRRKLEAERDQTVRKLRDAMTPMVKVLVKVVESKDSYTANHQSRVAELASAIAEEMGLPMARIEGLRLASMVHDIGKIQIPSEILNKPGKLSDIEFELIKTHVTAGYDILKNVDFPWPIARIVLEHHERVNGSGYPNGLTGKELLLESKILAVADVVEAMSNNRPYRPAMGIDAALAEIEKNKGVLYDPEVVDA